MSVISFIHNLVSSGFTHFLAASGRGSLVTGLNSRSEYILNHVPNFVVK